MFSLVDVLPFSPFPRSSAATGDFEPPTRAAATTNSNTKSTTRTKPKPQATASTANKARAKSPLLPSTDNTTHDPEFLTFLEAERLGQAVGALRRQDISTMADLKDLKKASASSREWMRTRLMDGQDFSPMQWVRLQMALEKLP